MKLFFLFVIAVSFLLAANSSKTSITLSQENKEPTCCSKKACNKKVPENTDDEFIIFQPGPFHI